MTRGRIAMVFPEAGRLLLVNLLGGRPYSASIEKMGLDLSTKRVRILIPRTLPAILLNLSIDLFIKRHKERTQGHWADQTAALKRQSAEKALAEAQKLRDAARDKPAPVPLHDSEHSKVEAMVHDLKIGSWLSMKNRLGEAVRCKVAVIYASTGKMVVTDKSGLRMGEYQRAELVDLIMRGEASILEVADSFEDSLSKVLKTLRKNP